MAADGAGYVCQAAALGVGRLVVVQPLLASTVVFALPIGGWILGQRAGRREWIAAAVGTPGLGAFPILADPPRGPGGAAPPGWAGVPGGGGPPWGGGAP